MDNAQEQEPKRVIGRPFQKGNPGKPKGSKHKKVMLRAAVVLALEGISPVQELLKIAKGTKSEQTRIALYQYLQSFVEAPQTQAFPLTPESPEQSRENVDRMKAHLAELSKPLDPNRPIA